LTNSENWKNDTDCAIKFNKRQCILLA
jgi:hypothetical protein